MTMRTTASLFSVAILSLGLITGCATTDEDEAAASSSPAEQAITDAKALLGEAKGMNYEWRDTGKMIKAAEKKLAAGDEAGALALANTASSQSRLALKQAAYENQQYLDTMAVSYGSSDTGGSGHMPGGGVDSYAVERGDNLWSISGKDEVYADPYQWPLIYKTNRDKIKDADLIFPGQVLDIDKNASASEIDAAVNHAKTRGAWSVGDVEQSDNDYLAQ